MNKPIVPREIRRIFAGQIFTVQIETLTLPNGRETEAELVRHPGSVVIIPVTDDDGIVLVRQYRHSIGRWTWELPAGSQEPGEEPEHAAVRECHEEIGKIPGTIEPVGGLYPTPGYSDEVMNFFRATKLRDPAQKERAAHDEDEDLEVRAFSRAEIAKMIASAEIIDMKTVSGLVLLENTERHVRP